MQHNKTTDSPSIKWVGYEGKYQASYAQFAKDQFGVNSYQASENYIEWLYEKNPAGADRSRDFIIGVFENCDTGEQEVVGCIHKMKLPWNVHGSTQMVPAIHNLMVAAEHRSGLGVMLIIASFKDAQHALIPSTDGRLAAAYQKLGCQKIKTAWFRKVLRPIHGCLQMGLHKILNQTATAKHFSSSEGDIQGEFGLETRFTSKPSTLFLEQIASALNKPAECEEEDQNDKATPVWTADLVHWRFFHSLGPKHLFVYKTAGENFADFAILSLGPRRGLNVARVIAARANSQNGFIDVIKAASKISKRFGAHVLLTFCADPELIPIFRQSGWSEVSEPASTFIYHKKKKELFSSCAFMGSAGDFGFEAISV